MAGDTVILVRAGDVAFAVVTSFARVPVPGEHNVPNISSASGLMENHIADVFAEAIANDAWYAKTVRWASGGDI